MASRTFRNRLHGFVDRRRAAVDGLEIHRVVGREFLREIGGGFLDGVLIGAAKKMDGDCFGVACCCGHAITYSRNSLWNISGRRGAIFT